MHHARGTNRFMWSQWLPPVLATVAESVWSFVHRIRPLPRLISWSPLVFIVVPLFATSEALPSQDQPGQALDSHKTLKRSWDPVIIEGRQFEGLFDGEAFRDLSVHVSTPEGFRSIPFQIDLIDKDGMVIPDYVNRVRKKAVYDFIPNKDKPTHLSARYQVLFMTKDAGGRYQGTGIPEGFVKGCEIEVQDPVDGGKGWVYLLKSRDPQSASCPIDYVTYELIKKDSQNNEQIRARYYTTGFPDADKPFAYGYWIIPEDAGGSGTNLLHTFRVRVQIKILGMKLDMDPKNNIVPIVLSYNDGPIRVTRRVHSSIVIKGLTVDWLAGDTKLETESQYYSHFFYFDGEVNLPSFLKKISKINSMFTTDFTHQATGLLWYNSLNARNGGCLVDGIMSPEETSLGQDPYLWSLIVGQRGGWANILVMHTESIQRNMELFYLDDMNYRDDKEPSIKGTWASTGYALNRLDKVEEKVSFRTNIFAIPRDFTTDDTNDLVNLVYQPIKVSVPRVFK